MRDLGKKCGFLALKVLEKKFAKFAKKVLTNPGGGAILISVGAKGSPTEKKKEKLQGGNKK